MPRKWIPPDADDFVRCYLAGESEQSLAIRHGVSRIPVHRFLIESGVTVRDQADANRLLIASRTPEQRAQYAEAAHVARRGQRDPIETRVRRARTRMERGLGVTTNERLLQCWLEQHGLHAVPQQAIGPYNADIAVDPVAVEIFGGGWHASGQHARRSPDRYRYILDQGWCVLIVWVDGRKGGLRPDVADYLIALVELARVDPAVRGKYWVIRGNGKECAAAQTDVDQIAVIPSGC